MVNSTIHGLLEHVAPFSSRPAHPLSTLLKASTTPPLRFHWSSEVYLIQLLCREARASSVDNRIRSKPHSFLVRQLFLPHSPFSAHYGTGCGYFSAAAASYLLALYDIDSSRIIQFLWPLHPFLHPGVALLLRACLFMLLLSRRRLFSVQHRHRACS